MEKKQYIPLSLLIILSGKALIFGATLPDVAFLGIFAALAAFYEFKIERNQLLELKKELAAQSLVIDHTAKEVQAFKSYLAAQKMNTISPLARNNAKLTF